MDIPTSMPRLPPISNLMSPPESKPLECFSPSIKSRSLSTIPHHQDLHSDNTLPPMHHGRSPQDRAMRILPSPPVSPWPHHQGTEFEGQEKGREQSTDKRSQRDRVLFQDNVTHNHLASNQPLFPSSPTRRMAEDFVDQYIGSQGQHKRKANLPSREEYLLALSCVPILGKSYNRNPGAYMKRARDEVDEQYWKAKRICAAPGSTTSNNVKIAPATPKSIKKANISPKQSKTVPRIRRTLKQSSKEGIIDPMLSGRSATSEIRAPAQKRPEDVDYRALPDFCPPLSTLPEGNSKCLKADWGSSNPLNLSNDPDRYLLHEAEVTLASTLRLSCATYLCSKRRIMEGRLAALRISKEFRKTDAQQACKIDVNKASKLWTAYDKVGWFHKQYFMQFL
ncbi:hypothetical protein MMC09_005635 [Bachmanniomyces sp. S44760]|nr:hypothetical protein [Bachmanniomyces sp. S44760]